MGLDVFEAYDPARARALADYYRYARDNDLYLTYVIINPQADRSKSAGQQKNAFLTAGVVDRDARGITIRGAKMLATGGIMANEVFVTCIQPLQPGDEKYAVSFAIPMNAQGPEDPLAQILRAGRAVGVRQSAGQPLRRERCRALFRRRQGAVGARVRRRQHGDVPEAVPRHAGARLPELPGHDPALGEAALPGRASRGASPRPTASTGFPPGARNAGPARGRSGHGGRVGRRDGGQGRAARPVFRARTATRSMRRRC